MKRIYVWSVFFVWCVLCIWTWHRWAAASELRYTRIAEGNISQAVGLIWENGFSGYTAIVRGDAKQWGRIRPLHWVYQQLPFLVIMMRDGDLWRVDSETPVSGRINGDLQTYAIFQMGVLALSIIMAGHLIWHFTGSSIAAIFVVPLIVSVPSLPENFLVNYCDSVEIGQIFFVAVYLVAIKRFFAGKAPAMWQEILAAFALACAYGMKETSVVVSAAWGSIAVLFLLRYRALDRAFLHFLLRHFGVHFLIGSTAVFFIKRFRSGSYATHYQLQDGLVHMLSTSWQFMHLPNYLLVLMFACVMVVGVLLFVRKDTLRKIPPFGFASIRFLVMLLLLAAGFFAINVPWGVPLQKYALPFHFFAMPATAILLLMSFKTLLHAKLGPAAALWALGLTPFVLFGLRDSRSQARDFYVQSYQYRKAVPKVAADIVSHLCEENIITDVTLLAGSLYQEGALPFMRVMNRMHHVNIARGGSIVSSIRAPERNYFHQHADRLAVDLKMVYELRNNPNADFVYVIGRQPADTGELLAAYGYVFDNEWWWGDYVARYVRKDSE